LYYRKLDRKVMVIHSVALTNDPAILNPEPILNKFQISVNKEHNMIAEILERLTYFFNLPLTSTKAEIVAELDKLIAMIHDSEDEELATEANKSLIASFEAAVDFFKNRPEVVPTSEIATILGMAANTSMAALKGHMISLANPTDHVSRSDYDHLKARLDSRDADDLVQQALSGGRITPAQKPWALDLATRDPQAFTSFLKDQPEVVPVGDSILPGETPAAAVTDELQLAINKDLGIDEETFKKYGPAAPAEEA